MRKLKFKVFAIGLTACLFGVLLFSGYRNWQAEKELVSAWQDGGELSLRAVRILSSDRSRVLLAVEEAESLRFFEKTIQKGSDYPSVPRVGYMCEFELDNGGKVLAYLRFPYDLKSFNLGVWNRPFYYEDPSFLDFPIDGKIPNSLHKQLAYLLELSKTPNSKKERDKPILANEVP